MHVHTSVTKQRSVAVSVQELQETVLHINSYPAELYTSPMKRRLSVTSLSLENSLHVVLTECSSHHKHFHLDDDWSIQSKRRQATLSAQFGNR